MDFLTTSGKSIIGIGNFDVSILSRRAYRLVLLKTGQHKWGRDLSILLPPFEAPPFTICMVCPETGLFIGYKSLTS
ncbi:MAG: hypothetical protein ACFFDT_40010 [Candidatus Hodarchaeota archaeon]